MLEITNMAHQTPQAVWDALRGDIPGELYYEIKTLNPENSSEGGFRAYEKEITLRVRGQLETRLMPGSSLKRTLISVTHSRSGDNLAVLVIGAVVDSKTPELNAIGVDLERADRVLSPKLFSRLVSEEEGKRFPLSPLQFWVTKEAAFKADPENQGSVVSNYRVTSFDSVWQTGQIMRVDSGTSLHFSISKIEGWLVAFALSRGH